MATRRNVGSEKQAVLEPDVPPARPSAKAPLPKKPGQPTFETSAIVKLLAFTLAMIVLPIGTYFFTLDLVFKGNSTWAGGTAALMANVVLIAYVVVAMLEDQGDDPKKTQ